MELNLALLRAALSHDNMARLASRVATGQACVSAICLMSGQHAEQLPPTVQELDHQHLLDCYQATCRKLERMVLAILAFVFLVGLLAYTGNL